MAIFREWTGPSLVVDMDSGSSKLPSELQCTVKVNPKPSLIPRPKRYPKMKVAIKPNLQVQAKPKTPEKVATLDKVVSKRVPVYQQLASPVNDANDSDIYDIPTDSVISFQK